MTKTVSLEVCANSLASALAAQQGGAIRVELCENLSEAGTTPSFGQIAVARKLLHIKLYVLIRPRAGDFLFDENEMDIILTDIENCGKIGCDGVVIGALLPDGSIDKVNTAKMMEVAHRYNMGVTFHRAFDICADYSQALEDIIELGCERILTSGGKTTAIEGAATIAHLVEQAAGRIAIMAGSGINENNVTDLVHFTGVTEVHTSAKVRNTSRMQYHNDHIMLGNAFHDLYTFESTDPEKVKLIIERANASE